MKPTLIKWYCYLYQNVPTAQKIKPDNWEVSDTNIELNAPNTDVAIMYYETKLKAREWRK